MLRAAAGIRDFLTGFASMMQSYEIFLNYANFFPTFLHKRAPSLITLPSHLDIPRRLRKVSKVAAERNQDGCGG